MIQRSVCLLLLAILFAGCTANLLRPPKDVWPEIGNEFGKSLRWAGTDLAATFFTDSARPDFLSSFGGDGGLQITNVRHDPVGAATEIKAQGLLTVEYYRSPSVSLKKISIPLEWSCIEAGRYQPCRWQIATLMSRLP